MSACSGHHPGTGCLSNWWIVFFDTFKNGLKLYVPLTLVPALIKRKGPLHLATVSAPEFVRSAAFLALFPSSYVAFVCLVKRVTARESKLLTLFGTVSAAMIAILTERKNRRTELGLYCFNLVMEVWYRMLEARGIVRFHKHGEVYVFMLASAILMYFYQNEPESMRSNVRGLFSKLLGVN